VTQVPAPRFNPAAGFFTNGVNVVITSDPLATIRYTFDNTAPTAASAIYNSPLPIRAATTVQARAFVGQQAVSDIAIASFARIYAFEGDGIPHAWREQYFGADFPMTDPRVDASADPDGDGATNLQEYVARTNPLDATSVLRLRARAVPQISWDSVPQMRYQLRRYQSKEPGISVKVGDPVIATGPVTTVVDEGAPDIFGIYALEVVPSP
jgi:hypothetical protein